MRRKTTSSDSFGDRADDPGSMCVSATPGDPEPAEGQPRVFKEKCESCIFRPGNPMGLMPGRLQDVVESNLKNGTLFMCHKTTYGQAEHEVLCRGFFDAYGPKTSVFQIYTRMGGRFWEVEND